MKFISTWRDNNFMWPIVCEGLWRGAFACKCRGGNDFSESLETALLSDFLHWSILNQDDATLCFMLRHHITVKNFPMLWHPYFLQQIASHVGGGVAWRLAWKVTLKEGNMGCYLPLCPGARHLTPGQGLLTFSLQLIHEPHVDRKKTSDWHVERPTTINIYTINTVL